MAQLDALMVFEHGTILRGGWLCLKRAGQCLASMHCPFKAGEGRCDWSCPHFKEPEEILKTELRFGAVSAEPIHTGEYQLRICHGTVIYLGKKLK